MIDEIDKKILNLMISFPEIRQHELAKKIGISAPAVTNRIKKLKKEKVLLGYRPSIDLHKLGYDVTVVITVRTAQNLEATANKWAQDPHVCAAYRVTGETDFVLVAKFRNTKELDKFNQAMFADESVNRTNTSLVFSAAKEGQLPNRVF